MKSRLAIYFLILCFFAFSGPFAVGFGGISSTILSSFGGCAGFNLSGSATGEEEGETGEVVAGIPVDMPFPLAKATDGMEPSTITLEAVGDEGFLNKGLQKPASHQSTDDGSKIVATLSGRTLNPDVPVALYNTVTRRIIEIQLAAGHEVAFSITKDLTNGAILILQVVKSDGSGGSYPTGLTIEEIAGKFFLTVFATLMGPGDSDISGVIGNQLAVTEDALWFSAQSSGENENIVKLAPGRSPETFKKLVNRIYGLASDFTNNLFFFDAVTNGFLRLNLTDKMFDDTDSPSFPTDRPRSFAVNSPVVAVNLFDPGRGGVPAIGLLNFNTGAATAIPLRGAPNDTIRVAWNLFRLMVYGEDDATGLKMLAELNLAPFLAGSNSKLEVVAVLEPPGQVTEMVGDAGQMGITYLLIDGEIFTYERGGILNEDPVVTGPFDVKDMRMSRDGRGLVFTKEDPDTGATFLSIFDPQTGMVEDVVPGNFGVVHTSSKHIAGIATLSTGDPQVIVSNNFSLSDPVPISFPKKPNVSTDHFVDITPEGGRPPYKYSIVAGDGSVSPIFGVFEAPSSTGMTTIEVEDSAGEMAELNIDVVEPGTVARAFGDDGTVISDFPRDDFFNDGAIQNGKIIAVGYERNADLDWIVYRFLHGGEIDETFGDEGKMVIDFGGTQDIANAVDVQDDGTIVVAGNSSGKIAFARLDVDGNLDPAFGSGGIVTMDIGDKETCNDVAIQSDGTICCAGKEDDGAFQSFAVVCINPDGTPKTSFGIDGVAIVDFGDIENANTIIVQEDDFLVIGGSCGGVSCVARLNGTTGAKDTTYDTGGLATVPIGTDDELNECLLTGDEHSVCTGFATVGGLKRATIMRLTQLGALDASFDKDGIDTFGAASRDVIGTTILQTEDDDLYVVAGDREDTTSTNVDVFIRRINDDGSADGFGTVTKSFDSAEDRIRKVLEQRNGHYLLFGATTPDGVQFDWIIADILP